MLSVQAVLELATCRERPRTSDPPDSTSQVLGWPVPPIMHEVCVCENQRTGFKSHSPPYMVGPQDQSQVVRFACCAFEPLGHLTGPRLGFRSPGD